MLIKVDSNGMGHVGYAFDNGVRVSVTFNTMTYSDNYHNRADRVNIPFLESKTVEVMQTEGNMAFNAWIHRTFGEYDGKGDPIGYVDVKHIPAILKRADSKVYATRGEQ